METKYREFDCIGCGENTATMFPGLVTCDDCAASIARAAAERREWIIDGDCAQCVPCQIAEARGIFL